MSVNPVYNDLLLPNVVVKASRRVLQTYFQVSTIYVHKKKTIQDIVLPSVQYRPIASYEHNKVKVGEALSLEY